MNNMANTYSQIYIQFVFAVQNRTSIIRNEWKHELYKYITGIIEKQRHRLFKINGMPDHIHILVSMNPQQSPSDLMYYIKRSSTLWVNEKKLVPGKFCWQEGFGAFSYGKSQVADVVRYIDQQEEHHRKVTFMDEYKAFLKAFEIEYNEQYVFKQV